MRTNVDPGFVKPLMNMGGGSLLVRILIFWVTRAVTTHAYRLTPMNLNLMLSQVSQTLGPPQLKSWNLRFLTWLPLLECCIGNAMAH